MSAAKCSSRSEPVTPGVINGYASFYIPPDGSKRGWEHAIANNEFRREVMEAAAHEDSGVEAAEVCFGATTQRRCST